VLHQFLRLATEELVGLAAADEHRAGDLLRWRFGWRVRGHRPSVVLLRLAEVSLWIRRWL
jgi:hypothetical protein